MVISASLPFRRRSVPLPVMARRYLEGLSRGLAVRRSFPTMERTQSNLARFRQQIPLSASSMLSPVASLILNQSKHTLVSIINPSYHGIWT